MKELSLNILDIAKNSVKAGANRIEIYITEKNGLLTLVIKDNGCGMTEDFLKNVTDPFCTTRTTRKVGMGIPFLKLEAEQTGGSFSINSRYIGEYPDSHGTEILAVFNENHIDFTPLGDVVSTIITLIRGNPEIDWFFSHESPCFTVILDTAELRQVLGDVPLDTFEVTQWITEYLNEQYSVSNK